MSSITADLRSTCALPSGALVAMASSTFGLALRAGGRRCETTNGATEAGPPGIASSGGHRGAHYLPRFREHGRPEVYGVQLRLAKVAGEEDSARAADTADPRLSRRARGAPRPHRRARPRPRRRRDHDRRRGRTGTAPAPHRPLARGRAASRRPQRDRLVRRGAPSPALALVRARVRRGRPARPGRHRGATQSPVADDPQLPRWVARALP